MASKKQDSTKRHLRKSKILVKESRILDVMELEK